MATTRIMPLHIGKGRSVGTAVSDISLPVVLKFEEALGQYAYLSTPILRVLYEMANATDTERVHVEGVTVLLPRVQQRYEG